jgi:hypothetical protein
MNNTPLKLPNDLAKLIENRWKDYPFGSQPSNPPTPELLNELVTTCFYASLQKEEGRGVRFCVAICDESLFVSAPPKRFSPFTFVSTVFRFSDPRRFNVHELVRLAPACDPAKTLIVAHVREGQIWIWGLIDTGSESSTSWRNLDELLIRVSDAGELEVMLHGARLCLFKAGLIHEERGGLVNEGCLYEAFKVASFDLYNEIKEGLGCVDWPVEPRERHTFAITYFIALDRLVSAMRHTGHGGCLLFVPEKDAVPQDVNIKYRCTDKMASIWTALKGRMILLEQQNEMRANSQVSEDDVQKASFLASAEGDVQRGLRDGIETIARFTAVDGAVILTKRFEILGFGAVVPVGGSSVSYKVFRCKNRKGSEVEEIRSEDYGTRHRSAFEFCHRNPGAVAFVASQDGGIKGVVRVGDDIHFWDGVSFDLSNELVPWNS